MVKCIVFVPCKTYSKSSRGINNQSKDAQKLHDKLIHHAIIDKIDLVFTSLDTAMMSALSLGQIRKDKLERGRNTSFIINPDLCISRKPINTKYLQKYTGICPTADMCLNDMDYSRCHSSYNYNPYYLHDGATALRMIHNELSTRDEDTIAIFCSRSLVEKLFPKKRVRYLRPLYYYTVEWRRLSISKPRSTKQKSRKKWFCRSGSSESDALFEGIGEICRCLCDCLLFDCDFG